MSLNNYPSFEHNPFRVKPNHFHVYTNLKEVNGVQIQQQKLADQEQHIRVFPSAYDDLRKLNSMAIAILGYIFKEIKTDYVRLNVPELMEAFSCNSKNTIYRGIMDLLKNKFIVRMVGCDMYFINPAKIYKGSRAEWYKKTSEFDDNYDGLMTTICTDERD